MSKFVMSLRRLFLLGKIDEVKINELFENGKLDESEKEYVLGE